MSMNIKVKGFTLTELLVSIAIIGIIAVITIPTIAKISERRKIETALPQFYSTINSALRTSQATGETCNYSSLYGKDRTYDENLEVLQNCFLSNLRYTKIEKCNSSNEDVCVYLKPTGEHFSFQIDKDGGIITWCIYGNRKRCKLGKTSFKFQYCKCRWGYSLTKSYKGYRIFDSLNSVDPYNSGGSPWSNYNIWHRECTTGTPEYCTLILKKNNWVFPKKYPIK